jgi:acyl CoA:acetate/3-ketoacid CoA transferase beta subunit
MEQVTRSGKPRLVERCAIPITAGGVVNLVVTNYGLFEVTGDGFLLREIAPDVSVDEIRATTGGRLTIPDDLRPVRLA